ncbi:DUF5675 family protein [Spirosoma utsteinense]|uniref:DUF5675 family protein n=1 Tax=Spirosoma utsteinense TaxID=2585773 RepID=UPI001649291D|nr:DUF5675 family protein [Spirosoma utsteinense]MBC3785704.1 hypothetical protein [Spirosoma utsteinense]
MIIQIIRTKQGTESTLSSLLVNNIHRGFVLEDEDRGLNSADPLASIKSVKVYGRTAIPVGRYKVQMTYSNRFKRVMPQLMNVPGFEGIRIHSGNYTGDTLGCLLPGVRPDQDRLGYWRVWDSNVTLKPLEQEIINAELRKELIWCEVSRQYRS